MNDVLRELSAVIDVRRGADAGQSYVAGLFAAGLDKTLKKVGEEAAETIIAAKNGDSEELVRETADLWFHTLVMLSQCGLSVEDVLGELERRFGQSGHEEKASRSGS